MSWKRHHVQHVKGFWKRPEDLEMGFGKDPCKVVLEKTYPKKGYGQDIWVLEKIQMGEGNLPHLYIRWLWKKPSCI